ncbi:hypothetical protein [Vibrio parahaemolyticus]|uniref:hypothetical protein n=1 Tax=Vibrio parahaemolyticus TaxID=670 RepID=UPI001655F4FE|nr:hypothetical protein [Vibrio parahaemolyticus]EJC6859582.1 hypothetical protein [Vibrio parahaemolyticus]MBC8661908.1 hypothetical protein [Vibrio parahaemolyticus]MBM4835744.1 hypothetical protein [Vibrio parahaemolyticus]MBM4958088.1 hypothetical protein [Vibrio parahaemolyticus]
MSAKQFSELLEFIKSFCIYVFSSVIYKLGPLFIPIISVNLLPKDDYSYMMISIMTFNIMIISFGFSFGVTANTCASKISSNTNECFQDAWGFLNIKGRLFFLVLFISTLIGLISHFTLLKNSETSSQYVFFIILSGTSGAISQYYLNALLGFGHVRLVSKLTSLAGGFLLVVIVSLLFIDSSLEVKGWFFVALLSIVNLMVLFLSYFFFSKEIARDRYSLSRSDNKNGKFYVTKTFAPTLINNGLVAFTSWLVLMIIGDYIGIYEAGVFSTLMFLVNIVLFVPRLSSNLILPRLVCLGEKGIHKKLRQLLLGITLNTIIVSLLYLLFYLSYDYIDIYYSETIGNVSTYFDVLIFGVFAVVVNNMISIFFVSENKAGITLFFNFLWSVCYIYSIVLSIDNDFISVIKSYTYANCFLLLLNSFFIFVFYSDIGRYCVEKCSHRKYG